MCDTLHFPTKQILEHSLQGVVIKGCAPMGQINIRGTYEEIDTIIQSVLGMGLPNVPNTTTSKQGQTVCWLGPDEWVLLCDFTQVEDLVRRLTIALKEVSAAVIDVSHNRSILELHGAQSRQILRKGCSLDLAPHVFPVGTVAQTLIGKVQMIVFHVSENRYLIFVRNSFVAYVYEHLKV